MGIRFRRSIKLAPGVRMNLGLGGLGLSVGPRGASIGIGSRGTYANIGMPGTGLSARHRVSGGSQRSRSRSDDLAGLKVSFNLQEDGTVDIVAPDGGPLPPRVIKRAHEQNEDYLRSWLLENCERWNKGIENLLTIHLKTPSPDRTPPDATRKNFPTPKPLPPVPRRLTLLARIFRSKREKIERLNQEAAERNEKDVIAWERDRDEHDRRESERLRLFQPDNQLDERIVQEYLTDVLSRVEWPRETAVSIELDESSTGVMVDVDLPEIEDMPDKIASVANRGLKLNIKNRSDTQRRREYMAHVHGVAFRLIGEVFSALPRIDRIAVSGFSQRVDRKSGHVADEYLFSVRVARQQWAALNFARLSDLDLTSCLSAFDLRRNMTATGVFKPIEPFTTLE